MGKELKKIWGQISNERGARSEQSVAKAMARFLESGEIPGWITGYVVASKDDDRRGIDGWIVTDVGKIPIQIKSSERGKNKHINYAKRLVIPVVVVERGLNDMQIVNRCIEAVNDTRKKYLEERGWVLIGDK